MAADRATQLLEDADNLLVAGLANKAYTQYQQLAKASVESGRPEVAVVAYRQAGIASRLLIAKQSTTQAAASLEAFQKSAQIAKAQHWQLELAETMTEIGAVLDRASKSTEALQFYQQAIELLIKEMDAPGLAAAYEKLAYHYLLAKDHDTARRYLDKAIEYINQIRLPGYLHAVVMIDQAILSFATSQPTLAEDQALESLSYFEADHGDKKYYYQLSRLYGFLSLIVATLQEEKKIGQFVKKQRVVLKKLEPLVAQGVLEELFFVKGLVE